MLLNPNTNVKTDVANFYYHGKPIFFRSGNRTVIVTHGSVTGRIDFEDEVIAYLKTAGNLRRAMLVCCHSAIVYARLKAEYDIDVRMPFPNTAAELWLWYTHESNVVETTRKHIIPGRQEEA